MLGELRGWGHIQNMFKNQGKIDLTVAAEFQDKVGEFVAQAINAKVEKELLQKTKKSHLTLEQCLIIVETQSENPHAFIDQIPEVLQEDFKKFITNQTISQIDGRDITYDLKRYYKKIYFSGISYPVMWGVKQ